MVEHCSPVVESGDKRTHYDVPDLRVSMTRAKHRHDGSGETAAVVLVAGVAVGLVFGSTLENRAVWGWGAGGPSCVLEESPGGGATLTNSPVVRTAVSHGRLPLDGYRLAPATLLPALVHQVAR